MPRREVTYSDLPICRHQNGQYGERACVSELVEAAGVEHLVVSGNVRPGKESQPVDNQQMPPRLGSRSAVGEIGHRVLR